MEARRLEWCRTAPFGVPVDPEVQAMMHPASMGAPTSMRVGKSVLVFGAGVVVPAESGWGNGRSESSPCMTLRSLSMEAGSSVAAIVAACKGSVSGMSSRLRRRRGGEQGMGRRCGAGKWCGAGRRDGWQSPRNIKPERWKDVRIGETSLLEKRID